MNRNNSWMWGLAAGLGIVAAIMYFFDPESGARRRERSRGKLGKWNRQLTDATGSGGRDLANRGQGLLTETSQILNRGAENAIPTVEGGQGPLVNERPNTSSTRQT